MSLTYFKYILYMLIVSIIFISCDPAEISIDLPEPGVTFSVIGQIDGADIDMSEDVVLFTHTRIEDDTRIYGGQLHSECQNLDVANCKRSLSITFMDSLSGASDIDGIPIILKAGEKELLTEDGTSMASKSICFSPIVDDSVFIDGQAIDSDYCITPPHDYFIPIEVKSIHNMFNPVGGDIYSFSTEVMARLNGTDIEYYYFSFDCFADSFNLQLTINIGGNSGLDLNDFDFIDFGGGGFNPNVVILHPLVQYEPVNVNLTMVNKQTGDVSNLWLFSYSDGLSFDSFKCEFPVTILDESISPVNNQGNVLVEYKDEMGEIYSSIGSAAGDQSFIVHSIFPYLIDESGNETVTSSISFNGNLFSSTGRLVECKNLDITFGFGYPAR